MLKIGGVVASRREHHVDAAGIDAVHGTAQELSVIPVVQNAVVAEGVGAAAAAQLPGDQRVGRAGGDAEVVLQNVPHAVLSLHQVDAGDVAVHALYGDDTLALGQVAGRAVDEVLRHHAVCDDALFPVDVL